MRQSNIFIRSAAGQKQECCVKDDIMQIMNIRHVSVVKTVLLTLVAPFLLLHYFLYTGSDLLLNLLQGIKDCINFPLFKYVWNSQSHTAGTCGCSVTS